MNTAPLSTLSFQSASFDAEELKEIYKALLLPRLIEERMLISLRQGKISKWFSAWGQEAISVGTAYALQKQEYICTMHRNLGVFTTRKIPLHQLFAQWQGRANGFTKGRDRSFHFGTHDYHIIGMISHLGSQMGVADGIALANKMKQNKEIVTVFTGDGGASEGDFHEAINLAAVWDLPVLIIVENNGWGLSTPSKDQFRCKSFADKGIGYGIEAHSINGNNILEVISTIRKLRAKIRYTSKPILLECKTFRMRGHEEASGTKYYPEGITDQWKPYDPIDTYQEFLINEGIINIDFVNSIRSEFEKHIIQELQLSEKMAFPVVDATQELEDVYAPYKHRVDLPSRITSKEMRFVDAIAMAHDQAMQRHPDLVLMGQDIADYGGVFKITDGLLDKYGAERVRNTPITEAAVAGAALGLSIRGIKSMMEMQFSDFATEGFNQIVNNLAKSHYRWGQCSDVVIRMPCGAGVAAGPYHSQSTEAWFTHVPGLKVAYPAFPEDAKGLLLEAFEDPNPVLFFEHKKLYRTIRGEVTQGYYRIPFGQANLIQKGNDLTIVTYGQGVHWAMEILNRHAEIEADLIDLRTLLPWDKAAVEKSVKKTGKVVVLQEANQSGGFMAEVASSLAESCFEYLDAPIIRCGGLDTPVPFHAKLEEIFLPKDRFEKKLIELYEY